MIVPMDKGQYVGILGSDEIVSDGCFSLDELEKVRSLAILNIAKITDFQLSEKTSNTLKII